MPGSGQRGLAEWKPGAEDARSRADAGEDCGPCIWAVLVPRIHMAGSSTYGPVSRRDLGETGPRGYRIGRSVVLLRWCCHSRPLPGGIDEQVGDRRFGCRPDWSRLKGRARRCRCRA